ncbi:MAG: prepilin-type N-terminal cleavage/methylation domain-containing protein [Pirellulales bacterium]|nr:prepilin-type N-terminal cleavage/methylation domain-containing protein [Pirellulales bacterium]
MHRRLHQKKQGFSLLEFLAVVAILGIIASLIVPRLTNSEDTAKTKVQEHQIETINSAIDRYYIDNNAFPQTLAALVPDYVPDGIPSSPLGGTYGIDSGNTGRVTYTPPAP